jgi:hypothetical protein
MPVDSRAFVGLGKEPLQKCAINVRRVFASCLLLIGCVFAAADVSGQVQGSTNAPAPGTYVCVQRGPDSRVWQCAVLRTNQSGFVTTNLPSYTELATGICYISGGEYVDSVEEIDPVANGAQATQGRYQVQWAANYGPNAVTITTPDNQTITGGVWGLLYFDASSGNSVLLSQIQNSTAVIASNTVIYGNAFSNLTADIRYKYRKAGLSQEVVLQQAPPSPGQYGMNVNTTWLQVLTEFANPPQPVITSMTNTSGIIDDRFISFGDMSMRVGHALLFQNNAETIDGGRVTKQWTNIDSQTFLIEEVPYTSVSNALGQLHSSRLSPDKSKVKRTVSIKPSKPRKFSAGQSAPAVRIARTMPEENGLMLDYDMLSGSSNTVTFQGDTTYYLSGTFYVDRGAIFEGGAVLKFTNDACVDVVDGDVPNNTFETAPYRPVIFTSKDDNSVGTMISGSSGNPSTMASATGYWNAYLATGSTSATNLIQNARFSYAGMAVSDEGAYEYVTEFRDCQFYKCGTNFLTINPAGLFENVLMSQCGFPYAGPGGGFNCQNVTIDSCSNLDGCQSITNGILTGVGGSLSGVSLTDCYTNSTNTGIYNPTGAASYYLNTNFASTNTGTTNIDTNLLADLQSKTVFPPLVYSNQVISNNWTLAPCVQRDNSGSVVALGYHYDPIDYALNIVVSNATVTVQPGTVLASMGQYSGVEILSGSLNCLGTATSNNWIVRYNTVQEGANTNWQASFWYGSLYYYQSGPGPPPLASFRLTVWSVLGQDGQIYAERPNLPPAIYPRINNSTC